jgi:predicted nucleic acid-binding protein
VLIVDSNVWIDLLAGTDTVHTVWLEREIRRQRIGVPDLVLCEVLQGVRGDASYRRIRDRFKSYEILQCGGEVIALAAAQNYRSLRKKGITVRKTIDCLLATFCINEGHSLLHHDRDFDPFEELLGLHVIHPQNH